MEREEDETVGPGGGGWTDCKGLASGTRWVTHFRFPSLLARRRRPTLVGGSGASEEREPCERGSSFCCCSLFLSVYLSLSRSTLSFLFRLQSQRKRTGHWFRSHFINCSCFASELSDQHCAPSALG